MRSPEDLDERTAKYRDQAAIVHGRRYIYGDHPFRRYNEPVSIICRIHGEFSQRLDHHLRGAGCPRCGAVTQARARRRDAGLQFVEKAHRVHGDRYDYSQVVYVDARTEVIVRCAHHGPFATQPTNHLNGRGCRQCGYERVSSAQSVTEGHVLGRFADAHGARYDYSAVRYVSSHSKITVFCRDHGPFETTAAMHAGGNGCPSCRWEKLAEERRFTPEQLMERLRQVHGERYDYDISGYRNNQSKLVITCAEHGHFRQAASSHLSGAGCPRCIDSKGERVVAAALEAAGVSFVQQFRDDTCRGQVQPLPFDFAIPSQRVLIEFDGKHHREPVRWSYSMSEERAIEIFLARQRLDAIKTGWAAENGWTLIRLEDKLTVRADLVRHGVIAARAFSNMASRA